MPPSSRSSTPRRTGRTASVRMGCARRRRRSAGSMGASWSRTRCRRRCGRCRSRGRSIAPAMSVCRCAALLSLRRARSGAQAGLDLALRRAASPRASAGVARPVYLSRRATGDAESCGRPSSAALPHRLRLATTRVVGTRRRPVAQDLRAPTLPAPPCPSAADTRPATGVAHARTSCHTPSRHPRLAVKSSQQAAGRLPQAPDAARVSLRRPTSVPKRAACSPRCTAVHPPSKNHSQAAPPPRDTVHRMPSGG